VNSFHGLPGKRFLSATHQLIRDREQLVLVPLETFQDKDNGPFLIDKDVKEVSAPVQLFFRVIENDPSFRLPVHPGTACLDLSQIHFPLVLRKWQKGDLFQPLGMSGSRKLSDFFVDNKLSINQKKDTWLLISAGIIIWVVGHRIDHRFRVTPLTDKILIIEMKS
jgi:tRNA(Ile)-lysidine synthase